MSALLRRSGQLRKLYTTSRQIFRFSNINKNFELRCAIPEVQQCACGSSVVFQRNLAKVAPKYENGEELSRVSDALPSDKFIDKMLSKIDFDAKRFGHVLRKDVSAVFRRIAESGTVSSIQSLYLIRCCGSLMCYEPPAQRIALVHEVWSTLQEQGIPMDASHYNALLKCYLENEHQFSPPEFLAAMEHKGIVPNRVTYQRIIEKYCCDGDLTGASAILEHMKEKDFPINESIFNCLVLGHARAKDLQGAVNMLDVMRKSQLEPSSETYAALACGYAENGDIEGFSNTLGEAEEKQLYFSGKNYLQMVSSLASSGNTEYVDEIIAKLNFHQHKPEAINTSLTLINRGLEDGAYKIIRALASAGFNKAIYTFLKALAGKEVSLEKMLTYCEDIFSKGIHEYIYEDAVKAIMIHGKTDIAFEFYKEMKKVGRPIRTHYFWPIFATYGKNGNSEGVWTTLRFMSDMALPADADTYLDFILPHVSTSNPDEIISKVKELGQSGDTVTDSLFLYYCITGQMKAAANFCRDYKPQCGFGVVTNILVNSPLEDAESVVMLLKQLREGIPDPDQRTDLFGMFLNRLFFQHHNNISLLERFLREYDNQNVKLPTAFVDALTPRLNILAPELVRLVLNLEMNVVRDMHIDADFIQPSQMNLEQLEKKLVHVKETGGNVRPLLRHLLSHYCRSKNLDRALEIKAEMDAINFTYSPTAYALLVNLFVSHNNLEEAMKYKKEIDEQYPHFKLDAAKAIEYIALMVKCDKVDEALELIKNEAKDWLPPRFSDLLPTSIKNLLHVAADTGNVEITQQLFQTLVLDLKFAPMHYTVLEPLIKVHIVRNDNDAAIEEYRKCVVNYNAFPSRNFLFKKFITSKDPERLQKVVDISTTYGGKEIALHELAAAFVDSGCVQEARKVIQTLGTKADMRQLDIICYRFFKQDKLLELEQFIGITKDLYHIDREQLYTHLLNLYNQNNDYKAALEMWNAMQEDSVQPSSVTLQRIADLLVKNNQPVPFIVPSSAEFQSSSSLMNLLAEKNEVEVVNLLRRMKKGEVHLLTPDVFTKIVDLLVEKKFLKEIVDIVQVMSCILAKPSEILKPLAIKYGEAGDVDSLKLLYDCMPDFAHKYMNFNSNFFEAYIRRGQPEALLDELEKNMGVSKNIFSLTGFLNLLQNFPEQLDRATKLADVYLEKENFDAPKKGIWLYHILEEKYEEAEEIYKKIPFFLTRADFPFLRIMQAVRATHNENLGRKLVDLANQSLKTNIKSRAYSCLLDVLVHNEKLEEAVALIEEASNKGVPTEKFLHPTLISLKKSLMEKNMPVPFVLPSEVEESGSSSSSDSD